MTAEEALRRLLAGTGLTYRFTSEDAVAVEAQGQGDSTGMQLAPITVQGRNETAWSPVVGYVANRSATGSKTDTPISEVPQSISVVTRDAMDARGVESVGEALAYSAGVTTGTRGDSAGLGGDNIAIRGFGGNGTAGASFNEYWDGLRMQGTNYAVSALDPYLFERIEVLRGPSSVLYGQNQPGGVVNRVSKRPTADPQGELQIRGGTFDSHEFGLDVGGPVTSDGPLSLRIVGLYSDRDAQTDYTGLNRKAVAPSVTWQPREGTSLTLTGTYQRDSIDGGFVKYVPSQGSLFSNPNGEIPRERFTGDPNYDEWERTLYSVGYLFEHQFDDTWTVRQNARYLRNELDLEAIYMNSLQGDLRTVNRSAFGAVEHSNAYTLDTQVEAGFATGPVDHTVLVGLDLQRLDSDTLRRIATAPTLDLFDPIYRQAVPEPPIYQSTDSRAEQLGVYAQDQVKFDRWILTLGGRQDWTSGESENNLTGSSTETSDSAFTGRLGLGYAFANGVTPYVSYAESFNPTSGTTFDGDSFEPLTGTQYEIGVKYEPTGFNAFLTLSAFHLTEQNVSTSDPEHPGFSIQTGEVRSQGLELEAVASLAEGWSMIGSYTFLDQEVTESNTANLGKRLTGVPRHSAALWSDYRFQDGPLSGFGFGGGIRYVGDTAGDTANSFEVPAVTLFDAAVSYDLGTLDPQLEGLHAAINARNLFDDDYVASCLDANRCYYGIGRTVMATVKFRW
jgi:iron complex outermembrane receptor protein